MTDRFIDEVLYQRRPALGVLWLGEPDHIQHEAPLGSPEHLAVLVQADINAGLVIDAVNRLRAAGDDILLLIGSDHGHQTVTGIVDIDAELIAAGLKADHGSDDVMAVSNGTSALIYVHPDHAAAIPRIRAFLEASDWAGDVFGPDDLATVGQARVSGLTFAVSMQASEQPNAFGIPGTSLAAKPTMGKPDRLGCGQHGGLGAFEQAPFLARLGFRPRARRDAAGDGARHRYCSDRARSSRPRELRHGWPRAAKSGWRASNGGGPMPDISLKGIVKRHGETPVLRGISIDIRDGEFLTLVGPSGCGKSTLLRIIAGLDQQDDGDVAIAGRSVSGLRPKDRDVAMVFQAYALYPHLSVFDNIALPLRVRRLSGLQRMPLIGGLVAGRRMIESGIRREVEETAAILDIAHLLSRKPGQLSGGQRQRVALGRAMVRRPAVFLMDEPLSNLDAKLRVQMRAEISRLHRRLRGTFVFVTHDQAEAMTMSDRVAVMMGGELVQLGAPDELYRRPAGSAGRRVHRKPEDQCRAGRGARLGPGRSRQRPSRSSEAGIPA